MKEKLPQLGQEVSTSLGNAKVISSNPLKEAVTVELETGVTVELPLDEITWHKKPPVEGQQRRR
jgi:cell fate regulator YaaT (PSP1 superfamily)